MADVVYVLAHLANLIPENLRSLRRSYVTDAQALVHKIPSTTDQIDRYAALATSAEDFDPQLAKQITTGAYRLSTTHDDLSGTKIAEKQQLVLMQLAYSLDKEFANSLATLLNDDPAKSGSRARAQALIASSEMEANLLNEKSATFDAQTIKDIETLPDSAWKCLGAMNCGRALPVHAPRLNSLVKSAAQFDVQGAYPILALVIENQRRMYARTAQGSQYLRRSFEIFVHSANFAEHAVHVISQNPYRHIASRDSDSNHVVINEGDSDKAKEFINDWIASHVSNEYLVCDPYFGPEDLSLLLLFARNAPAASVVILTGEEGLVKAGILKPYDDSYRRAWRSDISNSQEPPDSMVTIVGAEPNGKAPFHDRWILCELGGIRLGTSFNSLGKKLSELSMLSKDESLALMSEIESFVAQKKRQHLGQKLRYTSFSL